MARSMGLFEAKTNLSKVAEEVKRTGNPVTLTKNGEPWVDLVPHRPAQKPRRSNKEVFADLARLGQELPKSSIEEILADIREGRR